VALSQGAPGLGALHGEGDGVLLGARDPIALLDPGLGPNDLGGGLVDGLCILRDPDDSGGEVGVGLKEVQEGVGEGGGLPP
jgi:hypothetical protein